jgi:hypothetical protein
VTSPPQPIGFAVPPQLLFQIQNGVGHSFASYLYMQTYVQGGGTCPPPFITPVCGMGLTSTPALQITYASLAPSQVGMEEIDFVVPANQQPGNWPLFFNEGSCPSGANCGASGGFSSPYVLLPVGASNGAITSVPSVSSITDQTTGQSCNLSANSGCTLNVSQNDILQITGIGFSPEGGNTIFLGDATGAYAGSEWWLYEQDGYLFSDASRTQITAQAACYLPPGGYRFFVETPPVSNNNPFLTGATGIPNATAYYSMNLTASSSCQ